VKGGKGDQHRDTETQRKKEKNGEKSQRRNRGREERLTRGLGAVSAVWHIGERGETEDSSLDTCPLLFLFRPLHSSLSLSLGVSVLNCLLSLVEVAF
jgi:hypothetical protein